MHSGLPQVGGVDICVLSTPDMAQIWDAAVSRAGLQGRVRVVELPPSPNELPALLQGSSTLVLDVPVPDVIPLGSGAPETLVVLMRTHLATMAFQDNGYEEHLSFDFPAELYGSHSILHLKVRVGVRGRAEAVSPAPFLHTTGPGAGRDGDLALWKGEDFVGRGIKVSRDDPAVIEETFRATVGQAPLWVCPEFPFLVPRSPSTFKSLDGDLVEGLLCSSYERAGGWVVLTRRDVLDLLGHPGDVPWSRIPDLIGIQAAAAFIGWLASSTPPSSDA